MKSISVKVCGITRLDDARRSIDAGAEFLGFNFWPGSPRYVDYDTVRVIADQVRGTVSLVGVWVNPREDEVRSSLEDLGLDLAQFHGDEPANEVAAIGDRAIKVFQVEQDFDRCQLEPFAQVWGYLFDCARKGQYGGSGEAWAYEKIADLGTRKPTLLAGGLRAENVALAIERSGVNMVDVCSGVESAPGIKDPALLEHFFDEVRNAQEDA